MSSPARIPTTAPLWAQVIASQSIDLASFKGPDNYQNWQKAVNALAESLAEQAPEIRDRPRPSNEPTP